MANTDVSIEKVNEGFTIVTHLISSKTSPADTGLYLPATGVSLPTSDSRRKFLKREPKTLGTVQIMIGVITFLVGCVITNHKETRLVSGVTFWASIIYISSGALCVAAENYRHPCVVRASLVMNVISAGTAGVTMVLIPTHMKFPISELQYHQRFYSGNYGVKEYYQLKISFWGYYIGVIAVLLLFSFLQFIITICISGFTCKAICCQPKMVVVLGHPDATNYPMEHLPA